MSTAQIAKHTHTHTQPGTQTESHTVNEEDTHANHKTRNRQKHIWPETRHHTNAQSQNERE